MREVVPTFTVFESVLVEYNFTWGCRSRKLVDLQNTMVGGHVEGVSGGRSISEHVSVMNPGHV